jgi:hypothetical protein
LWEKFELNKEITKDFQTKSILKKHLLNKWEEKNWLERGRSFDLPKYKKSGYVVNVEQAFKDRLPYTLTFLNPLPILKREDYIYHLLIKDRSLPYSIFPEEYYEQIDKMNLYLTELLKRDSIEIISLHKQLMRNMNQFNFKDNNDNVNLDNFNEDTSKIRIKNILMNLSAEENYREIPMN